MLAGLRGTMNRGSLCFGCYKKSKHTRHWKVIGHFRVAVCLGFEVSFGAQLFEWLCTRTRFETEACSNSEMGY